MTLAASAQWLAEEMGLPVFTTLQEREPDPVEDAERAAVFETEKQGKE